MKPGMRLVPKPNFDKLGEALIMKKDLHTFSMDLITAIRNRTQTQNVDFRGKPFKAYTTPYSRRKGSKSVNLTGTKAGSRMLNSMKKYVRGNKGFVHFADANKNDIAVYNSEGKYKREFFEIGKEDEKMIHKKYRKLLDRRIKLWERLK